MSIARLKYLKQMIEKKGFDCTLEKKSQAVPFPHILFSMGPDAQGRERSVLIELTEYPIKEAKALSGTVADENEQLRSVHIHCLLPFEVPVESLERVSRLLMRYNQSLETPGWTLLELRGQVLFRQSLLWLPNSDIKPAFLTGLGQMMLVVEAQALNVEKVARGASLFEVQPEMEFMLHQITEEQQEAA